MVHFHPSSSESAQYYGHGYILLISVQNKAFYSTTKYEPKMHTLLRNTTHNLVDSMCFGQL